MEVAHGSRVSHWDCGRQACSNKRVGAPGFPGEGVNSLFGLVGSLGDKEVKPVRLRTR